MTSDAPVTAVVLTGPTGAGKTAFAFALAEQLPVEIISVDSAQVYRGLDIGTAKPSLAERARVPHHLIDIRDPAQPYSAGEFVSDAVELARAIDARGRVPLLVGGTMLYLRALRQGLARLPAASPALRTAIEQRAEREGWASLHAELSRVDPQAAARIHVNDPQRIQRALEVHGVTGKPISAWQRDTTAPAPLQLRRWALIPRDRSALHARLARRFEGMMEAGLLDEVARLYARGDVSEDTPAIRAVGYRQLWAHLSGAATLAEAVNSAISATRQLAKRQLTWLRADAAIQQLDPDDPGSLGRWIAAVCQGFPRRVA